MNRSSRLSNVFFTFLGAASVGLVVAVLAVAGVFDDRARGPQAPPRRPPPSPTAARRAAQRVGDLRQDLARRRVHPGQRQQRRSRLRLPDRRAGPRRDQRARRRGPAEFTVRFGEDGEALDAKLVGKDASTDLAVLEVDPKKVPAETKPLQLASSGDLRPGDAAIAIGSPFGLSGTVTTGIISALDREIESPNGFHDRRRAADRRGDQPRQLRRPAARRRGPRDRRQLADRVLVAPVERRRLRRPGRHRQGGRAAAAQGRRDRARLPRRHHHASTRTRTAPSWPRSRPAARRPPPTCARATGSSTLDGRAIKEPADLSTVVLEYKPGERVKLTVERGGDQRTIDVQLGTRPDQLEQG